MKKRALSIFLLSILVISCFLYVFPLNSLAETWFDNYTCWGFVNGFNSSSSVSASQSWITKSYSYNAGTSWFQLDYTSATTVHSQLPSPFYNLREMLYSPGYRRDSSSVGSDGYSNLSFSFNGDLQSIVSDLHISDDDFLCFCQLFTIRNELLDIHYTFGNIVTGNSFQPFASIDERFLVRNNGVSNMTTSSIIDTQLWSSPSAGTCYVLAYFNILGSDLLNYPDLSSLNSIVISLDFPTSSDPALLTSFAPLLYKVSSNGELQTLEYLNSIDNHVASIDSAIQSHVAPPTNYTDFSGVDQAEAQVSSKVNSIKNTLDDWALTSYISTGLSWVGAYTSYYFNEFGFIQAIYGIIVFFAIANVLRHGFFRTQRDYVTTDNYSVKGHNIQGDYEITGTRTTRRE